MSRSQGYYCLRHVKCASLDSVNDKPELTPSSDTCFQHPPSTTLLSPPPPSPPLPSPPLPSPPLPFPPDLQYLRSLVEEGEQRSFKGCYVFEDLASSIQEVEKCATMAVQIVMGKHKTRYIYRHLSSPPPPPPPYQN